MKDTDNFYFSMLLDDLAGGEVILQKASLIKISRLDNASFQNFAKMLFNGPRHFDESILDLVFEIRKRTSLAKEEAREATYSLQDFAIKTRDEILADWKSADVRIKLEMLKYAAQSPVWISFGLFKIAREDENALVRLEAENMDEAKRKPVEMNETAKEALIEKLAAENLRPRSDKPLKERRALVVDDSKTVQHILKAHLSPHISIGQAFSAAEASSLVEKEFFDIIFLDICMPDRSGLDLIDEFRNHHLKSAIVVMSSLDSRHIIQTAFMLGANYFVSKNKLGEIMRANKILELLNRF
jgi:CheY-like chemotaxis protein